MLQLGNFVDKLIISIVNNSLYTRKQSHKEPQSPSSIKESKSTSNEGRVESILTNDLQLKTDRYENNGSQ